MTIYKAVVMLYASETCYITKDIQSRLELFKGSLPNFDSNVQWIWVNYSN